MKEITNKKNLWSFLFGIFLVLAAWAKDDSRASQVIERNGKFYWYLAGAGGEMTGGHNVCCHSLFFRTKRLRL